MSRNESRWVPVRLTSEKQWALLSHSEPQWALGAINDKSVACLSEGFDTRMRNISKMIKTYLQDSSTTSWSTRELHPFLFTKSFLPSCGAIIGMWDPSIHPTICGIPLMDSSASGIFMFDFIRVLLIGFTTLYTVFFTVLLYRQIANLLFN